MSVEPPPKPLPRVKGRLPFEPVRAPGGGVMRQGSLILYAVLTLGLVLLTLYMAFVAQRPIESPWVIAPAIGSLWFGLRLFMIWGSSNARG